MRTVLIPTSLLVIGCFLIAITGPLEADGAVIVLDGSSVQYAPSEPSHGDILNVTATVLFIDADPTTVTLKWRLCTEAQCGLDTSVPMVRVGNSDMWKASIGPFPEKDPSNEPFIDVQIHVVAEGNATDGGEDPTASSPVETIYFKEPSGPDPEEEGEDSPMGTGAVIGGMAIAVSIAAIVGIRHRRRRQ